MKKNEVFARTLRVAEAELTATLFELHGGQVETDDGLLESRWLGPGPRTAKTEYFCAV